MVEGFSFGLIQSMVYGVASQELAVSEFDKYARTCSACSGLGCCLSLILGPFLFSIGGYFLPYCMLSVSFLTLSLSILLSGVLENSLNYLLDIQADYSHKDPNNLYFMKKSTKRKELF